MGLIFRIWAVLSGHKMIRLALSPQEGGYALVISPDLPGFSVMLRPDEQESFGSMSAAVSGPLEAFIVAECEAVEVNNNNKKVHIRGMHHTSASNLVAELAAA